MSIWRGWLGLLVWACLPSCVSSQPADTRRSGFEAMGAALQAMQRDDAQNPADRKSVV